VRMLPKLLHNETTGLYAAIFPKLGLAAYGRSEDEAFAKLKKVFDTAVRAHRQAGILASWLTESEANWCWERDYNGETPVENADGTPRMVNYPPAQNWTPTDSELPMAA
ncbi:MAG: hypothetical protein NTZ05_04040, partial [Chloroflexi bacterium]|nr:hypothetical protein [Chloroflexota bacterium]